MIARRWVAFAIGIVLLQAAAGLAAADEMALRRQLLEPHFHTYRPGGPGPFPAILFVSGCGGFAADGTAQGYAGLAEGWKGKGYVVAFVDYLAARGAHLCSGYISPGDVGRDVLAAAGALQTRDFIARARISAFGWSFGGAAVLAALAAVEPGQTSPLQSVVAYSPVCRGVRPWSAGLPVLGLIGADDDVALPGPCRRLFARLPPDLPLQQRVYPNAGHVFNLPGARGYNAAAAATAARDVDRFMSRQPP